jgi:hypothetical protein
MKNLILLIFLALGINSFGQSATGTMCFQKKTHTVQDLITISSDDGVNFHGTKSGSVQDEEISYYTSWWAEFTAQLNGNKLKANLSMEFEGMVEEYEEEWEFYLCNDAQFIILNDELYRPVKCPN